jgi:hypothetical protein
MFSIYCSTSSSLIWILSGLLITKASQSTGYSTSLQSPSGGILSPTFRFNLSILPHKYNPFVWMLEAICPLKTPETLNITIMIRWGLGFTFCFSGQIFSTSFRWSLLPTIFGFDMVVLPPPIIQPLSWKGTWITSMKCSLQLPLYLGSYINHSFKLNIVIGLYVFS